MCNPERSGFKARVQMVSQFGPRSGADRSVAYSRGGAPSEHEWARINKLGDVAKREEHHADVEQEAAEFETKYA